MEAGAPHRSHQLILGQPCVVMVHRGDELRGTGWRTLALSAAGLLGDDS